MRDIDLLQMALGLTPPWQVLSSDFNLQQRHLDIKIDFPRGSIFSCPECGQNNVKAYDTEEKSWRHLNFFQHEAYLTARVPRVQCDKCGIRLVNVPWACTGSGFTLLFEAMIMTLAKVMPVKNIASFVNEHDTRLWRVLHHYVDDARDNADYSDVTEVGVDETSSKRGHNYVSLFVDLAGPKVIFVTEGKDASTVERFKHDLTDHKGTPENIQEVCCDMSPAFISGVEKQFPNARLTFDKFHIMKIINAAVDEVRRQEQKDRPELARTRYIWLKNPANLKLSQVGTLADLTVKKLNLKTSRAYHIRLNFQELFSQPPHMAEAYL
nr:ISL3 family transposase [Desulfobulbaceae bacterium]